jgi:hypothetical protein
MKTLGGVGAVAMGAMLLLTVKIGPAESQPDPSRSAKIDPTAAVAAVPSAPPRRTPAAAAPVLPQKSLPNEQGKVILVRRAELRREVIRLDPPEPSDCGFRLELPMRTSAL